MNRPHHIAAAFAVTVASLAALTLVLDPFTLSSVSRIMSLGLLACSVAILTGWLGLPTLGQVAPYAVGAYATAQAANAGVTHGAAQVTIAAVAAALLSLPVGAVVTRARGITFLMVTLAVAELTVAAAIGYKALTGGSDGLAGIPPTTTPWAGALTDDRDVYLYVLAVTVVTLIVCWTVLRSPAGRLLRGCRDHEDRMRANGHPVARYLVTAYVGTAVMAGIAGCLLVTSQRYISPQDVSFEISAMVLLAVTIGGASSLTGSITAVAVVVLVRDWVTVVLPGRGPLLLGMLFIGAVYVLPDGLAGLPTRVARHMRRRLAPTTGRGTA
ncbi:branched-chain amino acid ABC transporter permease [Micromonospora sediminicola]|uniref:branched-chain amino acid ABC transporter permease n=1 Tax=Micromonospora sediminicola TaxID=946078 RepID=UPI0033C3468B